MLYRTRSVLATVAAAAAILVTPAVTTASGERASRSPVEITTGAVANLPDGVALGYDLDGAAVMVRTPRRTLVAIHVRGLDPSTTYPAHVHNAPCSATPAGGGHYQHEVGGPVDAVNEIWPVVTSNSRGRGHGFAAHGFRARPEAQSIVIHYPPDTSIRLACVDLG